MFNKTKQGVRDLNKLPSYSKGKKLPTPPQEVFGCNHKKVRTDDGGLWVGYCYQCSECGAVFDFDGKSIS